MALYAAASAMGYDLATSGGALWLASGFMSILPDTLKSGTGLYISTSFATGILTNFMSDGATVAAIGPETGEQLITLKDFFIHGSMVFILSMAVLWIWVFFGYWNWL